MTAIRQGSHVVLEGVSVLFAIGIVFAELVLVLATREIEPLPRRPRAQHN